jgi:hypothetical protein
VKKLVLAALLLALPCALGAQEKKAPVNVTQQVDRTAIWVGDDLRYTIRAVYEPNVEMVLDNFSKDRLPVAPFVLRDIDIQHKAWAGNMKAVEITLTLTTFETGKDSLTIPLVPLYYFVREPGAAEKERPVDSVAAAAMPIGLRSALVGETMVARTGAQPEGPGLAAALLALGLGLFGLLALGGLAFLQAWRRMHPDVTLGQLSREERERVVRASVARLHQDLPASGDDPRRWSGVLASSLRGMLSDLFQIPGAAQTPEEIEQALARSGADRSLAAQVKTLLGQCDALRYGRDDAGAAARRAQMLQSVEGLMQSPRWVSA